MKDIITIKGVECYEKDGTAYLKLEAVARGLGFTETAASGNECVKWSRVRRYLADLGGVDTCVDGFIPENIFYRLAMKAKNETAERFQAFIADEVIPSIRKRGAYMTDETLDRMIASPEFGIRLLTELKGEREKRKTLEAENETQRQLIADYEPKVQYLDTILESQGTLTTSQIAADYSLSARKLNEILHNAGIQRNVNGQWLLYRKHMGLGYTKSNTIHFQHKDGTPDTRLNTRHAAKHPLDAKGAAAHPPDTHGARLQGKHGHTVERNLARPNLAVAQAQGGQAYDDRVEHRPSRGLPRQDPNL